jgi:diguanylate cyclase (GGDEF)-like protein
MSTPGAKGGSALAGGQTTVIQRVLERRAARVPTAAENNTATMAVMIRVMPPPKGLLVFEDPATLIFMEQRVRPDLLDAQPIGTVTEALAILETDFRPVVLTDNPELVRRLRGRKADETPYILFVSELDDSAEREAGLGAGADDCIGRRASEREYDARIGAAKRIVELETALRVTLAENSKLSATDDLTRVASRRFFEKHFPREVERTARYGRALSLIVCDIDNFKTINDTLGHPAGDEILRQFGPRLGLTLRKDVDWVARIGGEEFAIVMPETPYEAAVAVARKLRATIAGVEFDAAGKKLPVTASFGVCGLDKVPQGEPRLADRILKIADAALYRSKKDGRNRVTAAALNKAATAAAQ